MAKKKAGRAAADVKGQHADSKGVNPKRDASRGAGQANVTIPQGQGTSGFRKRRKGGD